MNNFQAFPEPPEPPQEETLAFPYNEDFFTRFPYDLRRQIFQAYEISQRADINFYRNSIEETQREIQRRREQIENASLEAINVMPEDQQFEVEELFAEAGPSEMEELDPIQRTIVEAEDAISQEERNADEFQRMINIIQLQIDNRARLLRERNEPLF